VLTMVRDVWYKSLLKRISRIIAFS